MEKEVYLNQLLNELDEFNFKGSIEEEALDKGICFHIVDGGWSISRSHKILKQIVTNLNEYCQENNVDNSRFFILID